MPSTGPVRTAGTPAGRDTRISHRASLPARVSVDCPPAPALLSPEHTQAPGGHSSGSHPALPTPAPVFPEGCCAPAGWLTKGWTRSRRGAEGGGVASSPLRGVVHVGVGLYP